MDCNAPSPGKVTGAHLALAAALLLLLAAASFAQYAFAEHANFSSQDEQEIVRLVNRERQSRGLATLVVDERLQQAARKHSLRMAATGEVEHRVGERARALAAPR